MNRLSKARNLRDLHRPGNPLVLVIVWDVASARVVAGPAGSRALATASWSIYASLGYEDGGDLPLGLALQAARRIVATTELPVSVDFEKGYAPSLAELRENTQRLIDTGASG